MINKSTPKIIISDLLLTAAALSQLENTVAAINAATECKNVKSKKQAREFTPKALKIGSETKCKK